MAQDDIKHTADQFEKEMFLSDDSETDDESDKDYKSEATESERRCVTPVFKGNYKDFIKYMWKTVLHHGYRYMQGHAPATFLVCTLEGVYKPIILIDEENNPMENTLINYLETKYKGPMKMTIYINNSPCAGCARSLKKFLEKNVNIQLILHVTHLHNIKRKSCQLRRDAEKDEAHMDKIGNEIHVENYNNLRELMSLGGNRCRIEAFTKDVWEALLAVMGMSKESRKRAMQLYDLKLRSQDRSRQGEDRRIRKDLNHIKLHSDPWHEIKKKELS